MVSEKIARLQYAENMLSDHGADLKIIVPIGGNDKALFIQLSKEETDRDNGGFTSNFR